MPRKSRPRLTQDALDFRRRLLRWFRAHGRDLPWRRTRDPWSVLVSETMLQQTQVARVAPRYTAFLARFPTAEACAAAPVGDVLRLWSGLGYNGRAVRLHRAASMVTNQLGGRFPVTVNELRELPGVGPYTARAILAFAFEVDAAVVDTNVGRILARWHGSPLRPAEAQKQANAALPTGAAWAWNQSLMDLGATVCSARGPACFECPLRRSCRWHCAGRPEPDPGSIPAGSRQPRFDGSDRQGRGRLVRALARGPIDAAAIPTVMGWPEDPARAARVLDDLVGDGLAVRDGSGACRLP